MISKSLKILLLIIMSIIAIFLLIYNADLIFNAKISSISIKQITTSTDVSNYNSLYDNYATATLDLEFKVKGFGEYYFDRNVTIRNISDENHPYYYKEKSFLIKGTTLEVDKLTNGKYELALTAFTDNTKKKSYILTTNFKVTTGYNSREDFIVEFDSYLTKQLLEQQKQQALIDRMPTIVNLPIRKGNCYIELELDRNKTPGWNYIDIAHFYHNPDRFKCGKVSSISYHDTFKVISLTENDKMLVLAPKEPRTKTNLIVKPCEACFNLYNYLQYP